MAQGTVGVNILSNVVGIGGSNVGAFGDIIAVDPTPLIQADFVYGINNQIGLTEIANSGVADTNLARLRLQTGVDAAGSSLYKTLRIARYRAGEGMQARFTAVWASSAADSMQVVGVGDSETGYFFGYNGVDFGISIRSLSTDTWTAQTNWNGDKCDGTGASGFIWNKTNGNVMQIRYPYLGYGNITFWVQNPATSEWILCHTIRYTNSSPLVQVSNPSFPFFANVINAGNTSNLTMYVGSIYVSVTGQAFYLGAQYAFDNVKTVTTETNIFSLKNCSSYNGVTNQGVVRLRSLTANYQNNVQSYSIIRIKKGVTLGGTPAFSPIEGSTGDNGATITSGNSVVSADVAGTTIAGGTYIWQTSMCQAGNVFADLSTADLFIFPGEVLTISAFASNSSPVVVGLNWQEDV